jgi:catechol 2,3-dioxygenase-like lactoylglutathione lyase family enzyme
MSDTPSSTRAVDAPIAHRLVHCCYNTDDAAGVLCFLREGLGLPVVVTGGVSTYDAGAFGDFGVVRAQISLVFDECGPRVSAGLELHGCIDPPAHGSPHDSVGTPGIQALGLEVPDVNAALDRAIRHGACLLSDLSGSDLDRVLGVSGAVSIRDSQGVTFDLVGSELGAGPTRIRHLRLTCRDVDKSAEWYEAVGAIDRSQSSAYAGRDAHGGGGQLETATRRLCFAGGHCELILGEWPNAPVGEPYTGPSHRGLYRMALAVDDMSAAVSHVQHAGIALRQPPQFLTVQGTKVPPLLVAFFCDPDGVPVELIERDRSAFE